MKKGYVNLLVKVTNLCNLKCLYCFNEECLEKIDQKNLGIEDFKKLLTLAAKEVDFIRVIYHGGECTTRGIDFFKQTNNIVKQTMLLNNIKIEQSIQTNNTLINDEFAKFLADNKIKIGTSFDGLINDTTRKSTKQYFKSMDSLRRHNISCGAICVVTSLNVNNLHNEYEYFKKLKMGVNFNPVIISGNASKNEQLLSISYKNYAKSICKLFDTWLYDKDCNISVSPLDTYLKLVLYGKSNLCCYNGCIGNWFSLEPNGDIYPCNRAFPEKYRYGNIKDIEQFNQLYNSCGMKNLLNDSLARIDKCKKQCKFFNLCHGGCNNEALICNGVENNKSFVCESNKIILQYIIDKLLNINDVSNLNNYVKKLIGNNLQTIQQNLIKKFEVK